MNGSFLQHTNLDECIHWKELSNICLLRLNVLTSISTMSNHLSYELSSLWTFLQSTMLFCSCILFAVRKVYIFFLFQWEIFEMEILFEIKKNCVETHTQSLHTWSKRVGKSNVHPIWMISPESCSKFVKKCFWHRQERNNLRIPIYKLYSISRLTTTYYSKKVIYEYCMTTTKMKYNFRCFKKIHWLWKLNFPVFLSEWILCRINTTKIMLITDTNKLHWHMIIEFMNINWHQLDFMREFRKLNKM